jgi:phosphoribosylaminoimidazolecarboxamide formyltransferase/IMP cyclohydrolase
VATATQHQGKELSYNNINDTDAAFELVAEFHPDDGPVCAIIKHANPCGVARGATLAEAYSRAFDCDRTSAFGGIVALNRTLDAETAERIVEIFTEVVIAPDATEDAKGRFRGEEEPAPPDHGRPALPTEPALTYRQVAGGFWCRTRTSAASRRRSCAVTRRHPSARNGGHDLCMVGGQAREVQRHRLREGRRDGRHRRGPDEPRRFQPHRRPQGEDMAEALGLPESPAKGAVLASDAFFPFADGLMAAAEAGATAVIQPGGSMRDDEVIAAADEAGLAMIFTGMRHFRH